MTGIGGMLFMMGRTSMRTGNL